jgi:hypothetical protein
MSGGDEHCGYEARHGCSTRPPVSYQPESCRVCDGLLRIPMVSDSIGGVTWNVLNVQSAHWCVGNTKEQRQQKSLRTRKKEWRVECLVHLVLPQRRCLACPTNNRALNTASHSARPVTCVSNRGQQPKTHQKVVLYSTSNLGRGTLLRHACC